MYGLSTRLSKNSGWQRFDEAAHTLGRMLKLAVKFVVAVLFYILFSVVFSTLFNVYKPLSTEFFKLLDAGSHVFLSQNLWIMISAISQYRLLALVLMFEVTTIGLLVSISDNEKVKCTCSKQTYSIKSDLYAKVQNTSVFAYKQHVAFLA